MQNGVYVSCAPDGTTYRGRFYGTSVVCTVCTAAALTTLTAAAFTAHAWCVRIACSRWHDLLRPLLRHKRCAHCVHVRHRWHDLLRPLLLALLREGSGQRVRRRPSTRLGARRNMDHQRHHHPRQLQVRCMHVTTTNGTITNGTTTNGTITHVRYWVSVLFREDTSQQ